MAPILIIVGTNRPDSNARRLATIVQGIYDRSGEPADLYSLEQMPAEIFAPASYTTKPQSFIPVQERVVAARGLHIITPEYNGGFPGVLKYFIDMLKFPESFERKPVAFIGESAGQWGAMRPVEQLQQVFSYRNAYIFPERVFIPRVREKFDDSGSLNDQTLYQLLEGQVLRFVQFAKKLTTGSMPA